MIEVVWTLQFHDKNQFVLPTNFEHDGEVGDASEIRKVLGHDYGIAVRGEGVKKLVVGAMIIAFRWVRWNSAELANDIL